MTYWNATAAPDPVYHSPSVLTLACLYGVVLIVGLIGNVTIAVVILAQQGQRMRNHLVMNVCIADMLVCALTSTLTAATNIVPMWTSSDIWCKVVGLFQSVPVAVSTLGLTMLSLDRYASVKHPRLMAHQRHIVAIMVAATWTIGLLFTVPEIYARAVTMDGRCDILWSSSVLRLTSVLGRILVIHLVPCIIVAGCHLAVGQALCEVSLTAAAARGELPLPMPVLRRPKHVIIVAGVVNEATKVRGLAEKYPTYDREKTGIPGGIFYMLHGIPCNTLYIDTMTVIPYRVGDYADEDNSSDNEDFTLQIRADINDLSRMTKQRSIDLKKVPAPAGRKMSRVRRASKSERSIMKANRRLRRAAPFFSRPPLIKSNDGTQSLKSRRHLANLLILQVVIFAICWLPYVACALCVEIASSEDSEIASSLLPFSLLLGHAHSILNPVFYYLMNRQSLSLQGCGLWWFSWRRGESSVNLLHGLFRQPQQNLPRASSTNEAALGAFHPRYITPRAPVPRCHTSQYLQ